jgi:hypothetical protein
MQFNRRVLEEAEDPPIRCWSGSSSWPSPANNLDEYVEVRQAGLMQRIEDGYREPGYDGLRPDESLAVLTAEIHSFVAAQYHCWNQQLLPELRKQGIRLLEWKELRRGRRAFAQQLLPARGRSAADAHLDRPRASVSARAQQGALPGAAAARQAPQLRPAGAGRGHRAARACRALSACPRPTGATITCCCRT